jgi:hypothetical protein
MSLKLSRGSMIIGIMRKEKSPKQNKEEIQSLKLFGTLQKLQKSLKIYLKKIDIS